MCHKVGAADWAGQKGRSGMKGRGQDGDYIYMYIYRSHSCRWSPPFSSEVHPWGMAHLIPGQHDEQGCRPLALSLQPYHSSTKSSKMLAFYDTFAVPSPHPLYYPWVTDNCLFLCFNCCCWFHTHSFSYFLPMPLHPPSTPFLSCSVCLYTLPCSTYKPPCWVVVIIITDKEPGLGSKCLICNWLVHLSQLWIG